MIDFKLKKPKPRTTFVIFGRLPLRYKSAINRLTVKHKTNKSCVLSGIIRDYLDRMSE